MYNINSLRKHQANSTLVIRNLILKTQKKTSLRKVYNAKRKIICASIIIKVLQNNH